MAQLAQFSKTLGDELYKFQQQVNKDQMMEGYNLALSEPNPIDVSNEIKSAGEQLKADEMDVNIVALDIIKGGESLEAAQAVQNMSGWKRYGYAKGKAELAGAGWESYLSGQFGENGERLFYHPETGEQFTLADTATDPALRAYAITEMRKDYLEENGLTLMKPAFLNEFAGKQFRDGQDKFVEEARQARIVQQGQERAEQAINEFISERDLGKLFNQLQVSINDKGKPYTPSEIWTEATTALKAYQEKTGKAISPEELGKQPVPGDPQGRTYAERFELRMSVLGNQLRSHYIEVMRDDNTRKRLEAQTIADEALTYCNNGNQRECAEAGPEALIRRLENKYEAHNVKELVRTIRDRWPKYSDLDDRELLNARVDAAGKIDSLDLEKKEFDLLPVEIQEALSDEFQEANMIRIKFDEDIDGAEAEIDQIFLDDTTKFGFQAPMIRIEEKRKLRTKIRNLARQNATSDVIRDTIGVFLADLKENVLEGKFNKAKDEKYNVGERPTPSNPFPFYFKDRDEGRRGKEKQIKEYRSFSLEDQKEKRQQLFRKEDLEELARIMVNDPFFDNLPETNPVLFDRIDRAMTFARISGGTHYDVINESLKFVNQQMEPAQQIQLPTVNVRQSALNSAVGGELADKFILGDLSSRQARRFKQSTGIPFSRNMNLSDGERQVLDIIGRYESDGAGSYDAVNQFGEDGGRSTGADKGFYSGPFSQMSQHGGRKLTDLTVGEIMDLQYDDKSLTMEQWKQQGKLWAVGRYQFTTPTFTAYVKRMGISRDQKFTQDLQDEMAIRLYKDNGWKGVWIGLDGAFPHEKLILNQNR